MSKTTRLTNSCTLEALALLVAVALSETHFASLLPTDPKFGSMIFGGSTDTWYSGALTSLAKIAGVGAALPTECTTKHSADPGQCIYANESLPFVKTP